MSMKLTLLVHWAKMVVAFATFMALIQLTWIFWWAHSLNLLVLLVDISLLISLSLIICALVIMLTLMLNPCRSLLLCKSLQPCASFGTIQNISHMTYCIYFILYSGEDGTDTGRKKIKQLAENSLYFATKLREMGFIVYGDYGSPVIPLLLFNPAKIP